MVGVFKNSRTSKMSGICSFSLSNELWTYYRKQQYIHLQLTHSAEYWTVIVVYYKISNTGLWLSALNPTPGLLTTVFCVQSRLSSENLPQNICTDMSLSKCLQRRMSMTVIGVEDERFSSGTLKLVPCVTLHQFMLSLTGNFLLYIPKKHHMN